VHRNIPARVPLLFAAMVGLLLPPPPKARAQTPASVAELRIGGDVSSPLVLTLAELKKMPRKTLSVVNPHDKKTETYEGVLLEELLKKAGVAQGEKLR
jgi:DMSO/TMAO reductase YedYZ molybdopterin-dependent catalytic subunit